jgi:hypothetical protein
MVSRTTAGWVLVAIALLGLVASLGGILVGRALLTEAELALERSLTLTSDTLEGLQASITVAEDTVALVEGGLAQAETTTRTLVGTVQEGAVILEGTADLTEGRLADSLESVEESMPSLVQVAGVVDTTLRALSAIPFGPDYSPSEPFDESVREIQRGLVGVPDDLRAQAALIREAAGNLDELGEGTALIAEDLLAIREGMAGAVEVLGSYTATATEAEAMIADTRTGLGSQMGWARVLVTVLGLSVAAGQVVPLGLGYLLLQPPGGRPLLREPTRRLPSVPPG